MQHLKIFLLLIVILFNYACLKINTPGGIVVWGSPEISTITLDNINFNEIVVADKFNVTIQQGDQYSIVVRVNQNLKNFLNVEQKYTVLDVQMKPNHFYKDAVLEADITLPNLIYLDVNGISKVSVNEFIPKQDIRIDVTEGSTLLANLRAKGLFLSVKNSSEVEFSGSAIYLKAEGINASTLNMLDIAAQRANIYLSVGSDGIFNIRDRFVAELRASATMQYTGDGTAEKVVKDDSSTLEKTD